MRTAAYLAIGMALLCGSVQAATQEQIGSWVLHCPGDKLPSVEPCVMRFNKRFLDKGGITGDLEVQSQGKSPVPVIVLRGVSSDLTTGSSRPGKTEASMQFGGGPREDLTCVSSSSGAICSPNEAGAATLAAGLPLARSVTVRVSVSMPGMTPLPPQEKVLELSGTNEALAKLRTAAPSPYPVPVTWLVSKSPDGMMGMADKLLKASGFPNGMAQIQALIAKYMNKSK